MNLSEFLQQTFLDNTVADWLKATGVFLAVLAALWVAQRVFDRKFKRIAAQSKATFDDILVATLGATKSFFRVFLAIWAAVRYLDLPASVDKIALAVAFIAILLQVGIWLATSWERWIELLRRSKQAQDEPFSWLVGIEWGGRVAIWVVVLLIGLDHFGINVTGLVTGLGIGGVAIALAVQSILGDVLSAVSIWTDKPFVVGDSLKVGDQSGTVESIGFKTTRLRSPTGEQVVFQNSDILAARIHNYGRMEERRGDVLIQIASETPRETVERIPDAIQEIIEAQDQVRFERAHFTKIGEAGLVIEAVYYVTVPDYGTFMDVQQAINLALVDRLRVEKTEFGFGTRAEIRQLPGTVAPAAETEPAEPS
jgi:small-conductance mechanosensitive channel